jgi:Tol biopolymer transport system component
MFILSSPGHFRSRESGIRRIMLAAAVAGAVAVAGTPAGAAPTSRPRPAIQLVSVSSSGDQANSESDLVGVSANGRHVAFTSDASNLVPGDTNQTVDVFVRDVRAGTTTRVSVSDRGAQADGGSIGDALSPDGRFVVFASSATNLVRGDTNGWSDVFVRDLRRRTTTRVSLSSGGTQGDFHSWGGRISADGQRVAFMSDAANLVPGDTNQTVDVFVHDVRTSTTTRHSVSTAGEQADATANEPVISANGRYVAFISDATNLVTGDTNSWGDVFVRDLRTRTTTRVSLSSDGAQINTSMLPPLAISANGRYVAFSTHSDALVPGLPCCTSRIYLRDRWTHTMSMVSVAGSETPANDASFGPSISASGRYVSFYSLATDLVPGDTNGRSDIFVRDRHAGRTDRVNRPPAGAQADEGSSKPMISGDGRHVAFNSHASNLVPHDTNGATDVFLSSRLNVR